MNRFDRFTTEELKVINGALFRIIDEYERGDYFNAEEYKIAASIYPIINSTICQQEKIQIEKILSVIEEIEEREVAPAPEDYKVNPLYIEMKSERLQLLVTPSLKKALKEKAKSQSRSVNNLINSILEDAVKGEKKKKND
jgi:hypothetical protein